MGFHESLMLMDWVDLHVTKRPERIVVIEIEFSVKRSQS